MNNLRLWIVVNSEWPERVDMATRAFLDDLADDGHSIATATMTDSDSAGETNLLVRESSEQAEYGAFIDSIVKTLLNQISLSPKKVLKNPNFKAGLRQISVAFKEEINTPGQFDDFLIDQMMVILEKIIDEQQVGPIEVGAAFGGKRPKRLRSREEVIAKIKELGGDPTDQTKFNPIIISLLMYLPTFIEFITKLLGK